MSAARTIGRVFGWILVVVLAIGAIALGAVYALSGTDWGRERVRRIAQTRLNAIVHGKATIGQLSGNLLTGMTMHDLTITDSAGGPFVSVASVTASYSIAAIVRKQIWIDGAVAVRPHVVLDRPPNGKWNWDRIFPRGTPDTGSTGAHQPGWLDRVRFTNATVIDGEVIVRAPWSPSERLSPSARDSLVRNALAGGTRLTIQRSGDGFQKVVTLDSISAKLPLLRLAEPGQPFRLVKVASLSMNAYPFRPPAAAVRDVKGVFPFNNDSVWWKGAYATLPSSAASGDGSYAFESGDLTITLHSDHASFGDMRWIYPRLPDNGTGSGDLRLTWRGGVQDYLATNTNVALDRARLGGSFGITMGDTITVHDTKMRFSALETSQLETLIPHFKSPRVGSLSGSATVHGGRHALAVNGEVSFNDRRAGLSHVVAVGDVGLLDRGGVRARDLTVQLEPLQVTMARTWYPNLPIEGTVTGSATINGSTTSELVVAAKVDHRDRGTRSVADGTATVHLAGNKQLDVDLDARPVSLEEVGRFFPAAGLQGTAVGPVRIAGPLANLRVTAEMRLPDGGRFTTTGTLDVASSEKAYDLTSSLHTLNLRTIDSKAPVTSLTAQAHVQGRGTQLATMQTAVTADLSTSNWRGGGVRDSVAVDTVSLRASIANGQATIDRLYAVGARTTATASGTFGLTHEQTGTLSYRVSTDSLGAFNRLVPRADTGTVGTVPPRPLNVARAIERARADSARIDRATEMERLINGKPAPALVANVPKPVPADTLLGKVAASGTLSGNLYDFDLKGTLNGQDVVARGSSVHRLIADYTWTHARTPQSTIAAAVIADSASLMGFEFDSLTASATYTTAGGHAELAVTQNDNRRYAAKGDYALLADSKELHLADLTLQFDTVAWSMVRPSVVTWGQPGIRVADFELRNRGAGRIYANGLLPTEGAADFTLNVDNFPVSNVIDLLQTDLDLNGIATVKATMEGTLSAPTFHGTFELAQATYNKTTVPSLRGKIDYADRALTTHLDAVRATGQSMATVDGKIPINLALSGVTGDRFLPDPMSVNLVADSLPLELIPPVTDAVQDLHGIAAGTVTMRGTLKKPALSGGLTLRGGSATIASTGAKLVDATATVRMANDTVYVDSVAARTTSGRAVGTVSLRGTLAVGDWREPAMNLTLTSRGAQLLNNLTGTARVDADLALKGPFRDAHLTGTTTIVQGVIYAPEPNAHHFFVGAGDPALYNVLDTLTNERDLFPPMSPLLANLTIEIALSIRHDTWVRNREANVEVYTDDPMTLRQEQQSLSLTGVLATDRGEYDFLSKRFQIKRGSALFIGTPDLDPTLQITGEYQVSVASRGAVNVRVLVGGTLRRPKVSLESDAQPPKTQSELLSLLAFGPSTTSLSTTSSSSIAGSAASSDLFGIGAQVAAQRLAGVALGVAVQQVEIQAGRAFGTDVFTITPGDVPLFGGSGAANFFTQTQIEAGKYVNGRTFISAQEQAGRPGLAIEQRTTNGWRFSASMEPRILLGEPTLSLQPHRTTQAYGGFVLREWRF